MRRALSVCTLAVGLAGATAAAQPMGTQYIAGDWDSNAIVYLDADFNSIGSFDFGATNPNGIATDGTTIWAGTFGPNTIFAYDLSGTPLYNWSDPNNSNLQGMEFVNGNLAIANLGEIRYHDPVTGAFNFSIPNPPSVEGIAYDAGNNLLFTLGDEISALDPDTGAVQYTIPNAASGEPFGATGLTYIGGDQLAIGSSTGNWFIVDSTTGDLIDSGNNGVNMFALKVIPAPGAVALLSLGGLFAVRRRR